MVALKSAEFRFGNKLKTIERECNIKSFSFTCRRSIKKVLGGKNVETIRYFSKNPSLVL